MQLVGNQHRIKELEEKKEKVALLASKLLIATFYAIFIKPL